LASKRNVYSVSANPYLCGGGCGGLLGALLVVLAVLVIVLAILVIVLAVPAWQYTFGQLIGMTQG
jgi:hypothetical protein